MHNFFNGGPLWALLSFNTDYLYENEKAMNVNINHPSVIQFLSEITQNIVSNISLENYFKLSEDNKMGISYAVLKLIKNSADKRTKLTDLEFRALIAALWKKNEENENYEIAAILNHISKNYDSINEVIKTTKRPRREIKADKANNDQ